MVRLKVDGRARVLDLSPDSVAKFEAEVMPWLELGRPAPKRPNTPTGRSGAANADYRNMVRAWATENGYKVGVRGRISEAVYEAYSRAH